MSSHEVVCLSSDEDEVRTYLHYSYLSNHKSVHFNRSHLSAKMVKASLSFLRLDVRVTSFSNQLQCEEHVFVKSACKFSLYFSVFPLKLAVKCFYRVFK